jgi:hypothetical protein
MLSHQADDSHHFSHCTRMRSDEGDAPMIAPPPPDRVGVIIQLSCAEVS